MQMDVKVAVMVLLGEPPGSSSDANWTHLGTPRLLCWCFVVKIRMTDWEQNWTVLSIWFSFLIDLIDWHGNKLQGEDPGIHHLLHVTHP